jgi:ribosomal-protein-alanine N-acetyltransferase
VEDARTEDDWHLRRAVGDDVDSLHALACIPLVYRHLFDGAAPDREFIAQRVAQSIGNGTVPGLGMWILDGPFVFCRGLVELRPHSSPRSVELTYLLHPDDWGRGLAVRMAWTAITYAFGAPHIDAVIAGADLPNAASFAVMRRLRMRFHRDVRYPMGAGAEFVLNRGDTGPLPRPALILMH